MATGTLRIRDRETTQIERALWRALAEISPQVQVIDGEGEEVAIIVRLSAGQRDRLRSRLRELVDDRDLTRVMR